MSKAQTIVSKKEFTLQQEEFNREVNAKRAETELSTVLQETISSQQIRKEQLEIQVISERKQVQLACQEIERITRILEASIKRPADAEAYEMLTIAEAEKTRIIKEAESMASSVMKQGLAEANVIKLQGNAEALKMAEWASAIKQLPKGAFIELLIQKMPEITKIVSDSLCNAQISVIDGNEAGVNQRMALEIQSIVESLQTVFETFTGFDLYNKLNA